MKQIKNRKVSKRAVRHNKVRSRVFGLSARPRLSVFRSNRYIYAQIIDDSTSKTLVSASDLSKKGVKAVAKRDGALLVGKEIAKKAKEANIKKVVFDRGGFRYAGRIKVLADAARTEGLEF